jgi:hypothetical protein
VDAVIASMSIPLIFEPVRIRGTHDSMYFADGGLLLNFPWSAFETRTSLGFWLVESPKSFDSLLIAEERIRMQGKNAPSGVPGLHVVVWNLQRSLIRRISVGEHHQFLRGPRRPRHHVIPLFTNASGLDFAKVDVSFSSEMIRRGIFLAAMHYLAIPASEEAWGSSWCQIMTAFASLYENVTAEVMRRICIQQVGSDVG